MKLKSLKVQTRAEEGKGPSGRMRKVGAMPAVLYGLDKDPISLTVNLREFTTLVYGAGGEHAIVELEVEDKPELNGPTIVKDVQHHPVRDEPVHADFFRIDLDKKIRTLVPVKISGHAVGIVNGGVLDHQLREIEIECLALDVPEGLIGVITELDIGMSLHVSDLAVPENVTVLTTADRPVLTIHPPRVIEEVEEVEEGIEGEEAAESTEAGESDETKSEEKSES